MNKDIHLDPSPWWRHRMMWLVVGGPAIVVVAAVATAVIAVRGAEDVLSAKDGQERSLMPALQGRNHAATPERLKEAPGGPEVR